MLEKDKESLITRRGESERQLEVNLREVKKVFDGIARVVMERCEEVRQRMEEEAGRRLEMMEGAIN